MARPESAITFDHTRSWRTAAPTLDTSDVHLWLMSLNQPPREVEALQLLLSEEELIRTNRFRFETDRRTHIVSRGLLKRLLGVYLNIDPPLVRIAYNAFGKPSLTRGIRNRQLHFNLAHSGEFVLFGFTQHQELGVDLELLRASDGYMRSIANRFFAADERAMLNSVRKPELSRAFFRIWTRKEAYVKAIGQGVSYPFETFDVTFRSGQGFNYLSFEEANGESRVWSLYDLRPAPNILGALVLQGVEWHVSAWRCEP